MDNRDVLAANTREAALAYFRTRDDLSDARHKLVSAIAEMSTAATQEEIAEACHFDDNRSFHRTRIQQFLREARQRGNSAA